MSRRFVSTFLLASFAAGCANRQSYEQSYLGAGDNWLFRRDYARADHLFNAFDYGHGVLAETLLRGGIEESGQLEGPILEHLTCRVLRSPPDVPLAERAVAPSFAKRYPRVLETFEWAHMLHRQLYDILADRRLDDAERASRVAAALAYYRARSGLALSSVPKSMALMEEQSYSLTFRHLAPNFNRVIWSYHWLQMAIYDALLAGSDDASRHRAVNAAVAHFYDMVAGPVTAAPTEMPMSAAVAPIFSARYEDAAIIFDNLHALHDVVSDVLASRMNDRQRDEAIARALERYLDSTSFVTTPAEWHAMAEAMSVVSMGGTTPSPIIESAIPPLPPRCSHQ